MLKLQYVSYVAFCTAVLIAACVFAVPTAQAEDFIIGDGVVETEQQVLDNDNDTLTIESGARLEFNDNDTLTIESGARLEFNGNDLSAVVANGNVVTVINDGTVVSSGDDSPTVGAGASGAKITNNGSLTTSGSNAYGIDANDNASNATIINNGDITTEGDLGHGISSGGVSSTITSSGTITTGGNDAIGIWAKGNAAGTTVTHSGTITTTGDRSHGILVTVAGATVTNSGAITTAGTGALGIVSNGAGTTITNTGVISLSGTDVRGIYTLGDTTTITHSGTLTLTGEKSNAGIHFTGEGSSLTVSGGIFMSATDAGSYAILGSDANSQILNILPGAQIVGRINLGTDGTDNDVVNVMTDTRMASATLTFEEAETINLATGDMPALRSGDTVVILDPTGASATRMALGSVTGQIRRQVFQHLGATPPAATEDNGGWGAVFGSRAERDEDGLALAFDQRFYGVVGGYDGRLNSGQRVGLFAGVGQGRVETDVASIKDTADRVFMGLYGQHAMGDLSLDGAVMLGYARHDSSRTVLDNLAGYETADGDYNSVYISPSLALAWSQELGNGLELRPRAQIAYTYGHYGSYTESGTTNSNISFDSRSVSIIDGRLQLALAQSFAGERGEIEWRAGATLTHYGNDNAGARLGGDSISYRVPGETTIPGGYTGVSARYASSDRVSLVGDLEYGRAEGRTESLSAHLGLVFKF